MPASLLVALALILVGARLGGALFERASLPPVLGELLAGVVLGNLGLLGVHALDGLAADPLLRALAQLGVLLLLFDAGLESSVGEMLAVGRSSALVAVLGVLAPLALGALVTHAFFPALPALAVAFVGATLCATSVGITARVLADLGHTRSRVGRIVLGAAVIDDVLGLLVLAVLAGLVQAAARGARFDLGSIALLAGKALVFLAAALLLGRGLSRRVFARAARADGDGLLFTGALVWCLALAWLATRAGLAPIVGAFAAGLVLEPVHLRTGANRRSTDLREVLRPLLAFFVPVFFVVIGMGVTLGAFAHGAVPGFALALTLAAIVGKQVCSLGVLERGADRLAVGFGMIPRGEVGLIFAGIGATLRLKGARVIDDDLYAAVVAMVALTTLLTPPLLAWRLRRVPAGAVEAGER